MNLTKKILTRAAAAGYMALLAPLALAQSSSSTASTTSPGIPNTGAGGDPVAAIALLAVSAATVIAGAVYLSRNGALSAR